MLADDALRGDISEGGEEEVRQRILDYVDMLTQGKRSEVSIFLLRIVILRV